MDDDSTGISRPLDLIRVRQPDIPDRFCFLSVNWGLVSDVDFESERYRFMGGARFTVGAVVRIINLRFYKAKLLYLPADQIQTFCLHNTQRSGPCPQCLSRNRRESEHQQRHRQRQRHRPSPLASRTEEDKDKEDSLQSVTAIEEEEESQPLIHEEEGGGGEGEWKEMKGDFVTIVGTNVTHIGYDVHIAPFAHFSDGSIDLCVIKKCTRNELATSFLELDTGKFVNTPSFNTGDFFEYIKVKAFRVEPLNPKVPGVFGFDGERGTSVDPIECESLRGIATIYG